MRELVLVLPDLFLHAEAVQPVDDASLTALRFAAPRVLRGGWRGMLARGLGREDLALADEASVIDAALLARSARAASSPEASSQPEEPWIATPLYLMAGLKTLHFPANGLLALSDDDAAELAREFARIFGDDGLELVPAGSAGFVLRGFVATGAVTVDPSRLIGASIDDSLPSGPGSADLRALASEIEMWLHDLPLNRRRMMRGEAPVSSLWLWGGGQPPRDPLVSMPRVDDVRWDVLRGDDAWTRALAALAGVACEPLAPGSSFENLVRGDGEACCMVVPVAGRSMPALDRELIAPAVRALHEGRIGTLVIAGNDRWVAVRASDRLRLWRPRRTVMAALADSLG